MKLRIEKSVTVITPTIGSSKLNDAVKSVREQTYKNITHLLVADGPEYMMPIAVDLMERNDNALVVCTPENTGKNGFYGHRIYAAYPHLINSDYIFFLDEDNWYEPDHVATLVDTLERGNDFAYSLRQIYTPDKQFIAEDNCESLGKWPIFFSHEDPQYLIDTSSYAFTREFIQKTCHLWHSGWGGDRKYLYSVMQKAKYDTNGKHTLCYRLDGNPGSVNADFFIQGNKAQEEKFKGVFLWKAV